MASKCIDRTDLTTLNTLALTGGPTVDASGAYTINQIDVIAKQIADNVIRDSEQNPVLIAYNRYGQSFYDASAFINGDFRNLYSQDYEELDNRYTRGNITTIEFADFLDKYNYTPSQVTESRNYEKLARELNNYYTGSFADSILGGLCNTIGQIFDAVDSFFDMLGVIDDIVNDAIAFVQKIRSYDGIQDFVEQEIVKKLIEDVKQKIKNVIQAVIKDVRDAIENFNILGFTIDEASVKATKAIMTIREQSCVTLSPENEEKFLDKVEATIDYLISKLESIDLESVQLVVARICALGANIEALIRDIKSPLDSYGVNYERIVRRIQNMGKIGTSTAIKAGAIRYSPEVTQDSINSLKSLWDGTGGTERITPSGNEPIAVAPITKEEYQNLPRCGKVMAGDDERLKVAGDWVENLGPEGYSRVDLDVKVYLMRVQQEMNIAFTITSGWRSKEYNESIGGDKDSSHLSGLVIDIENSESLDIDRFSEIAFRSGFRHVVVYDEHIHLDIREMAQ